MGIGRIFPGGALGDFSKIFLGGKSGEICFFHSTLRKQSLFAKILKIHGGQGPHAPLPTTMDVAHLAFC